MRGGRRRGGARTGLVCRKGVKISLVPLFKSSARTGKIPSFDTTWRFDLPAAGLDHCGDSLLENDILAMRNLVNALEDAAEGSAVLDLRLERDLQREQIAVNEPAVHGLMAELSAETVETIVGETVVPFTRSLDAALPGENIVFCMYSVEKNLWVSVNRDPGGQEFVSWATTEPLSRRAAALRAIARISARPAESDVVSLSGVDGGVGDTEPKSDPGSAEAGASEPGWRVNF